MEEILVSSLKSPSSYKFVSFDLYDTETVTDIISDAIRYYSSKIKDNENKIAEHDELLKDLKRVYKSSGRFKEEIKSTEDGLAFFKKQLEINTKIIDYLKVLNSSQSPALNDIASKTYKIVYDAQNSFGAILRDVCYGDFDIEGKLERIKVQENGEWSEDMIVKFHSIPGFDEFVIKTYNAQ